MQLDKVDLCGRHVNVGRPKGYVEPPGGAAAVPKLDLTQMFSGAAAVGLMPGGGLPGSGPMPNMPGGQIAPLPGNTYMSPLPGPPQPTAPTGPSRLLMLNNLLTAVTIWDDQERQEVKLGAAAKLYKLLCLCVRPMTAVCLPQIGPVCITQSACWLHCLTMVYSSMLQHIQISDDSKTK